MQIFVKTPVPKVGTDRRPPRDEMGHEDEDPGQTL